MNSRLYVQKNLPFVLYEIIILQADDKQLLQISQELVLALSIHEMKTIQRYYTRIGRNPTDIELQTIGQTWSEHCCHKTFKGKVVTSKGEIDSLLKTYFAKSTRELSPSWCISVFEDNAGIIHFENETALAVKVETHNHPSAIEPFGGAATGTGGVIRDILGVWADPIACTDILGFGPLDYEIGKLPSGLKHPKYVFRGVVAGIGSYGNNMGIPTVNGAIYFDESYTGNVVVYCGCIGILPIKKYVKNGKSGDCLVLVGGRTGRDGIHGVTFASLELTEKSEETSRPAVQVANPIEEEKLKRAIITIRDRNLGSSITDLGGGGLSSAIGETGHRFKCGVKVILDNVPLKYSDIPPWEIYISESQERMLLTVPKDNLEEAFKIFEAEDVGASVIGTLIDDRVLRIVYKENKIAELDMDFLFITPQVVRRSEWKKPHISEPSFRTKDDLKGDLLNILASPNVASKEKVIRTYDHEVKGNTVLKPICGEYEGPGDASIIKPLDESWKGVVISCGMNPEYGKIDPYWMAASVIDEAIRNNTAVGGRRIALLDNFVWGNPEKPDRMGGLVRACQACYRFSKGFKTPFISGKDSLYNESPMGPVTPTLLITAVGITPDIRKTVSMDLKSSGNLLYLVGVTYPEMGGSEYYKTKGFLGKSIPKVRIRQAKKSVRSITKAIDAGYIRSCHDLSEGGLSIAASEMAFSGGYGLEIDLNKIPRSMGKMERDDYIMFSESNSRFLIEVPKRSQDNLEELMRETAFSVIGSTKKEKALSIYGLGKNKILYSNLTELRSAWKSFLGE